MILAIAIAAAATAQSPIGRDIDRFCNGAPACVARQRESLRHFLGISVAFDAAQTDAERCMRAGKTAAGLIDWTAAEKCLRAWSAGRRSMLPGAEKGPSSR